MSSGFSFGENNGGGGGSNTPNKPLFGATTTSGAPATSLFGGANAGSNTPASKPLFGTANTGDPGPFGSAGGIGSSTTPAASKPSLFGAANTTAGAPQPGGGFSFGTTAGTAAGNTAKPSAFGSGGSGSATSGSASPFSFGTTAASGSIPAATPAPSKTFSLPSTTPAGPPPGTSLFGAQSAQSGAAPQPSSSNIFGAKPAATSSSSTPGLFGAAPPSTTAGKPLGSTAGGGGLFGFANKDASSDVNKAAATPALFAGAGQNKPSDTKDPQATPKPNTPLFGGVGSTTPSSTPAAKPGFGFGAAPASAQPLSVKPSTTAAGTGLTVTNPVSSTGDKSTSASTAAPASNPLSSFGTGANTSSAGGSGSAGFGLFNKPNTAPTATTATSGATTTPASTGSSPFPNLEALGGLGGNSTAASSGPAMTSTAASTLFGGLGANRPTTTGAGTSSSATTAPTTTAGATTGATSAAGGDTTKSGFASSTAGPAPSAQSRLKNKSMDEIITRWASDLSKYQKEFQSQAETVANWDRALVENSDKVKQLYAKTFQAERDATEVERQLTIMEENQQELDTYLDRYEKEIENLMRSHGVSGRSDSLRGPDQERERTYRLAEKLQDRLNELNKDLTEMIEEINSTSQTLSKTGKADDPLTKVVRVLNSQLSQLQLIDSGAAQLQNKITKAQKESQRVAANGWSGLGTDPADDFYRSFRGGRTDRFGGVS